MMKLPMSKMSASDSNLEKISYSQSLLMVQQMVVVLLIQDETRRHADKELTLFMKVMLVVTYC